MSQKPEPELQLPSSYKDLDHVNTSFYAMAAAFNQDPNMGRPTYSMPDHRQHSQSLQESMVKQAEQADLKKQTHREVERRRRETINNGIQQLAELIPGGEKNKGRILMRAIQYIHELKSQEATNIEKWTLEKLILERAMQEYSQQIEQLKQENLKLRIALGDQSHAGRAQKRTRL